jgi:hypothetical protein
MPRPLIALLALPLAAAACGGSKHAAPATGSPLGTVKAAFEKTFAAGSESVDLKANAQSGGQSLVVSGSGAVDTKRNSGTLKLHVDAGPLATSLDEIVIGRVAYLRSPLLADQLPSGKSWIKLDDRAFAKLAGLPGSVIAQNPSATLKYLQHLKSAREIGTESAGTRYRATLDRSALPSAARSLSSYDVWVGDDGFIHRVRVAAAAVHAIVTVDLSDFGKPVSASAPPKDEVYAAKGALPGLGG